MGPQPLAQRMTVDQAVQLWGHLEVPAEREVRVEPFLQRRQTEFGQPGGLGLGEPGMGQLLQWRTAEERQCFPEDGSRQLVSVRRRLPPPCASSRSNRAGPARPSRPAAWIPAAVGHARWLSLLAELLAQPRHVGVQRVRGRGWGRIPHMPSISRSLDTTWLEWSRSTASAARCLAPPRARGRPSFVTSSGPNIRNSTRFLLADGARRPHGITGTVADRRIPRSPPACDVLAPILRRAARTLGRTAHRPCHDALRGTRRFPCDEQRPD